MNTDITPQSVRTVSVLTAQLGQGKMAVHLEVPLANRTVCGLPIGAAWLRGPRLREEVTCPICQERES